jgi:RNA polymerase sigma-70 factor, ECF subfamily
MAESDERILVERACRGEVSAFREIVERYQRQIYFVSLNFTGNHHDAEDVLQDVLIKAYRSLHKFRGEAKLGSWLHRITINTCIDRERRTMAATASTEEIAGFAEQNPGSNPERRTEADRIRGHIDRALRALTPLERSVFILRNYNDLKIKEVAQVLGRSEGTVKNMLWRALKKLKKELAFYRKELGLEASK